MFFKRSMRYSVEISSLIWLRETFEASVRSRTWRLHSKSRQHRKETESSDARRVRNVMLPDRSPACHVLQKSQITGLDRPFNVLATRLISYGAQKSCPSSSMNRTPAFASLVGSANNSRLLQCFSDISASKDSLRRRTRAFCTFFAAKISFACWMDMAFIGLPLSIEQRNIRRKQQLDYRSALFRSSAHKGSMYYLDYRQQVASSAHS